MIDAERLKNQLLSEPAAYSDIIIELALPWIETEVHALSQDAEEGFVVVATYPGGGKNVSLHAFSPAAASRLFDTANQEADLDRLNVTSEEIACALADEYNLTVRPSSEDYIHYATDVLHFKASDDVCGIQRIKSEEVGTLHAFVAQEEALKNETARFATLDERAKTGKSLIFMAADWSGKDAGYIEINEAAESTPLWEVDFVYVKPQMRRRGIGKQLLSIATKEALDAGLIPLYTVSAQNTASRTTCESVGYYKCLERWTLGCDPSRG